MIISPSGLGKSESLYLLDSHLGQCNWTKLRSKNLLQDLQKLLFSLNLIILCEDALQYGQKLISGIILFWRVMLYKAYCSKGFFGIDL